MNIYKFYNKPKELITWHPDDLENNGQVEYKKDGQFHREGGPAVELPNGSKYWYLNGKLHRKDGPAVINLDGINEWWINGSRYSENIWKNKLNKL